MGQRKESERKIHSNRANMFIADDDEIKQSAVTLAASPAQLLKRMARGVLVSVEIKPSG